MSVEEVLTCIRQAQLATSSAGRAALRYVQAHEPALAPQHRSRARAIFSVIAPGRPGKGGKLVRVIEASGRRSPWLIPKLT